MLKNRILTRIAACVCCLFLLAGCGENFSDSHADLSADTDTKISIVCTAFPQYDWAREVIGDKTENFDLTLLSDTGVDLHNYQPAAEDIAKVSSADIFICVGGASDQWTEDALKEAANKEMQVIDLLAVLGDAVKEEEVVEGMQEERQHGDGGHLYGEEAEYDEHVWLSLKNAEVLTGAVSEAICRAESSNAETYISNADTYIEKLDELDKQYEQAAASAKSDTLLFGDRFPFRYLLDDYGLNYYAAFAGCSAETEASFETITFLSGKVDELGLNSILVMENSDKKIAETIKQNTSAKDQDILTLHSIQSVTRADIENGFTYLKAMQDNLKVLEQALN